MQLIHQYFTLQSIQISQFANILPLQNFSVYGKSTCIHRVIYELKKPMSSDLRSKLQVIRKATQ